MPKTLTQYKLPGYYSNTDAERIANKLRGKSYMNFIIEYGGIAGNNEIIVMTQENFTGKELQELFIYCALTL